MPIRVAFLNCYNLFTPQQAQAAGRGPTTVGELDTKLDHLASTLRSLFAPHTPDLVGLCEVGDEMLGRNLAELLEPGQYATQWAGDPPPAFGRPQTSLMVCYKQPLAATTTPVGLDPNLMTRKRWLAMELRHTTTGQPFWFVVNHWKSQMGGARQTDPARMDSAREVGEFYLQTARITSEAMILVGDFNCEPGDSPLREQDINTSPNQLRAVRERQLVQRKGNRLAYFYNPMWRMMGEPDPLELSLQPDYTVPRPIGTHAGNAAGQFDWRLWDQMMVTRPFLLAGAAIRLVESSVRITPTIQQASDHAAIRAVFDV